MQPRLRRWLFDRRLVAAGHTHALGFGDSHAEVLWRVRLPGVRWDVLPVTGATALGVVNPNSRTDALRTFDARIGTAPIWQPAVSVLGEVDCGFLIFHRAERRKTSIEAQLHESVGNYLAFLDRHADRRRIVLSVPLPTTRDNAEFGEPGNARREVAATLSERTELTLRYNDELRGGCASRGVEYVDVTTPQLDPATGRVSDELRHPLAGDHHLHPERFAAIIAAALRPLLGHEIA